MKGKLVVFEGLDGCGKKTQLEILKKKLIKKGFTVSGIEFPRYSKFYGKLIGRYLCGEFGSKESISPYLACLPFAMDRHDGREAIKKQLDNNDLVLVNRYVPSSEAFFGARFTDQINRTKFIEWLNAMEYGVNKLIKPHCVLFLDIAPEIGQELVLKKGHRRYLDDARHDIHEADIGFQKKVRESYNALSKRDNWTKIECSPNNKLRSTEDIAEEIWKIILPLLPPKT